MAKKAVVLFGHGARDPQWAEPMKLLQAKLEARVSGGTTVTLAFLELMEPDLPTVVQQLAEADTKSITVIPIFFGRGGHLKKDFPLILADLRAKYPHMDIDASDAVGQWEAVWDAIAQEALKRLS